MSGELGKLTVELAANVARLQSDMGKAVQVAQNASGRIVQSLEPISSQFDNISGKAAIMSGKFMAITAAVRQVAGVARAVFAPAMDAVESYNASVVKAAAMITSMTAAKGGNIAEQYKQAKEYAAGLQEELIAMDARSIANARQIGLMNEEFIKGGVLLDINNQKQKEGFENIANALAVIAAGTSNANLQFSQEIRGLMSGVDRPENALFRQLQAIDPALKEHIKLWKEQGTLIENVGSLLVGYKAASGDISSLWTTITSTFKTLYDQVLRSGMQVAFQNIVQTAQGFNEWIREHKDQLGQIINKGWLAMRGIVESIGMLLEPFVPMLKGIAYRVNLILDGWGMIAAVALPTVTEKLMGIVKVGLYFAEIVRSTAAMFSDFIGVLGTGLVSLGKAAMQSMVGDFSGAQETLAGVMSGAYAQALKRNADSTKNTFNALKSEFAGLFDLSGFDQRMAEYNRSGAGKAAITKRPDIKTGAGSETEEQRKEAEKLAVKLGEIRNLETEALEAAASFSKWSLGNLANLSPAISGPSLLGPVGDPTAAWKMSPEEMEKMAAAQRSIQEATTRQQLAAVEAMERFGQISQPDALRRKIELERQSLEYQQQALEAINQNADEGRLAWLEQATAIDETRYRIIDLQKQLNDTTAIGGMMSAMQDYAREAQNLGAQVKDFSTGVFQGMENAMVNFVKTGKMNFKDLANSIIEDLIRIAIRASITGPLASAIGGINWGSMFSNSSAPQAGYGMSGGLLASAAGGYDIPSGINPVTQLHEREMVLPAQYADVIRSMAGGGSSAPSVIVNIENKTGQQMTAKQGGMQFDGKQFVISTIVENVENNGVLRGMMAGAGAY